MCVCGNVRTSAEQTNRMRTDWTTETPPPVERIIITRIPAHNGRCRTINQPSSVHTHVHYVERESRACPRRAADTGRTQKSAPSSSGGVKSNNTCARVHFDRVVGQGARHSSIINQAASIFGSVNLSSSSSMTIETGLMSRRTCGTCTSLL